MPKEIRFMQARMAAPSDETEGKSQLELLDHCKGKLYENEVAMGMFATYSNMIALIVNKLNNKTSIAMMGPTLIAANILQQISNRWNTGSLWKESNLQFSS